MPWRMWLRCDRNDVDHIRSILKTNNKLEKRLKIKTGANENERIIPTTLQSDNEEPSKTNEKKILQDLGLEDVTLGAPTEIKWLPSSEEKSNTATTRPASIEEVILRWLEALPATTLSDHGTTTAALLLTSPKRYTIYSPMVLLAPTTFQAPPWSPLLQTIPQRTQTRLWKSILDIISTKTGQKALSHLAINVGIPSTTKTTQATSPESENILRAPSHLVILHGNFGPLLGKPPVEADFEDAFWVCARQNGVVQTWAPRYTMFSRGNIKEKARILSFHGRGSSSSSLSPCGKMGSGPVEEELSDTVAVDLYAGIGYFAFSYVALGVECVLCWEINPWSVEGLRRGAVMNGWGVRVVRGKELGTPMWELLRDKPRLLVFEESNEKAVGRMQELREYEASMKKSFLGDIIHVNCGFLPSSEPSWLSAWQMVCKRRRAWLHLHENVGWNEMEARKKQIADILEQWPRTSTDVHLHHVELVKTFAPDVWHCVFDVYIAPAPADAL